MQQVSVNIVAVIIAAFILMVLGFFWYGPLFGKEWMKLIGMTEKKMEEAKAKGMTKTYALSALGALVMAYVLAHIVAYSQARTIMEGLQAGFWVWLGFVATIMLNTVLYDGKPWKLYLINTGYYLVALLLMGAVLASWM